MCPACRPWVPEISCLLSRELALPLQGLLLGQQLGPFLRQSCLLLQGPLQSVHLGLSVLQAVGQLLLQGQFLTCDLEEGEGASRGERERERESGASSGNGLQKKWFPATWRGGKGGRE